LRSYPHEKVRLDLSQAQRWRSLTLVQRIEQGVADPGQPALVFEGRARTWGQMREQSRRIGNALLALGVEPADRVGLLSRNRLEYLEIETGIAAACAIMVALNWRLRETEIAAILRRAGATVVIAEAGCAPVLRALQRAGHLPGLRALVLIDGEPQAGEFALPALLALLDRKDSPHAASTEPTPSRKPWPRGPALAAALLPIIACLPMIPAGLRFESNLLELQSPQLGSVRGEKRIFADSASASWFAASQATSLDEVAALEARAKDHPEILRTESILDAIPRDTAERAALRAQVAALAPWAANSDEIVELAGHGRVDLAFSGSLGAPDLRGDATLSVKHAQLSRLGTTLEDLDLRIAGANGRQLAVEGRLRAGPGSATVDGQLAAEAELMCTLREIDPSVGGGTP
jgi:hypothetical protein